MRSRLFARWFIGPLERRRGGGISVRRHTGVYCPPSWKAANRRRQVPNYQNRTCAGVWQLRNTFIHSKRIFLWAPVTMRNC